MENYSTLLSFNYEVFYKYPEENQIIKIDISDKKEIYNNKSITTEDILAESLDKILNSIKKIGEDYYSIIIYRHIYYQNGAYTSERFIYKYICDIIQMERIECCKIGGFLL